MNTPNKRGRPPGPKKEEVEGEKKKLGRPKKVKAEPVFDPQDIPVEAISDRPPDWVKKFCDNNPEAMVKSPVITHTYDPYQNPRFKSKNNLK